MFRRIDTDTKAKILQSARASSLRAAAREHSVDVKTVRQIVSDPERALQPHEPNRTVRCFSLSQSTHDMLRTLAKRGGLSMSRTIELLVAQESARQGDDTDDGSTSPTQP